MFSRSVSYKTGLFVSAVAAVFIMVQTAMAQQTRYSVQNTLGYVASVTGHLERLQQLQDINSSDQAIRACRQVAADIRKVPWDGVDSEAVNLAWSTAALLDKGATLIEKRVALTQRAIMGGFAGGRLIGYGVTEDDPLATLIGLGVVGLEMYFSAQAEKDLNAQTVQWEAEGKRLGDAWKVYTAKLDRQLNTTGRLATYPGR